MQHAILQVMKCVMAIKGIGHQGQRLSWQISIEPQTPRTANQSVEIIDHAERSSNNMLKYATQQLLKSSDGKCLQARICQDVYKSAFTKAHLAYSSQLCSLTQRLQIHIALSSSKSRLETLRKAYPKAQKDRKNCRPEIRENARTYNYFALPQHAGSKAPNWYQSKELSKTNPAPPISLQTTTEIDGKLTEKGSDEQY
ncbi:hypothetical protein F511_34535 [Dorcoceras hygrometricum]|uniref:Uncharacterized protein n=1 Tax=Dorcoceras hygrometricum TaxID=472368 RepID=A0A2Z7BGD9_9LAMI|nr:hypothetical protein F511_34535 [Dorcoceras hygrometricum]